MRWIPLVVVILAACGVDAFGQSPAKPISRYGQLLKAGEVDQATQLFDESYDKLKAQGDTANLLKLINVWLDASALEDAPKGARATAVEHLAAKYSWRDFAGASWDVYASVAVRLWENGGPAKALEYSRGLLGRCPDHPAEAERLICQILTGIAGLPESTEALAEARKAFVLACAKQFPASHLGRAGGRHVSVSALVAPELFRAGAVEEGLKYARDIFPRLSEITEAVRPPGHLFPGAAEAIIGIALNSLDYEQASEVLCVVGAYGSARQWKNPWGQLMARLPEEQRQASYLKLLQAHGPEAFPAAGGLLGVTPMGATAEEVVSRSSGIIPMEMEMGTQSGGLDHLVKELKGRNAFAEIEQITGFFWRSFPTTPVGAQAFGLWIEYGSQIAGEAETVRAAQDVIDNYPSQPIAARARLALAEAYVSRGQVLEGLLMAHGPDRETEEDGLLTIARLRALVERYAGRAGASQAKDDLWRILMALGDQLDLAGEHGLARLVYWEVTGYPQAAMRDPRTDLPLDPPAWLKEGDARPPFSPAVPWRILALIALGREPEAKKVLDTLGSEHPQEEVIGLAHFFLAKGLLDRGQFREAWQHLSSCPPEIRSAPAVAAVVSTVGPKMAAKKTEDLKTALAEDPTAPDVDETLLRLGRSLSQQQQYAEAVLKYEALVKQHSASARCPEALYRAIVIYETKIQNPQRAAYLSEILKARYPQSRYVMLLDD